MKALKLSFLAVILSCSFYSCNGAKSENIIDDGKVPAPIEDKQIPIIYSSDLFHPPGDIDDHYDLVVLFMMQEFDIKALIFDISTASRQPNDIGLAALRQIASITNRPIPPYAVGLRQSLTSQDDRGEGQASQFQAGVELILTTLQESDEKVVLFLVGSCRDFAAAYNRDSTLLKEKVAAVYVNAGCGPDGEQNEWNVGLDRNAYLCLLKSDLPIYWCPCLTRGRLSSASKQEIESNSIYSYNTFFTIPNQAELVKTLPAKVQNLLIYAATSSSTDPIEYLVRTPGAFTTDIKGMWSIAPLVHAAGRKIYVKGNGNYFAYSPQEAQNLGIDNSKVDVFLFHTIRLSQTSPDGASHLPVLAGELDVAESSVQVFQYIYPDFNEAMVSVLANIMKTQTPSN
ncbi:hypothetical protein AGMMS4956_20340 [Bacteroidia bacterium]|nr:hypothetical protein AGMMS4956_20340 [Bacteroidia bacterium]